MMKNIFAKRGKVPSEGGIELATVHLTLECGDKDDEGRVRETIVENETLIARHLRRSLSSSVEPKYFVQAVSVNAETKDILAKIGSHTERIGSYENFTKLMESLLQQQRGELLWLLRGKTGGISIGTSWYPSPIVIRSEYTWKFRDEMIAGLKHPLALLLIGTLIGSLLIPNINEQSNERRLRHEERLKIAISIIEQSHETDRRMSNLMNFLNLFHNDHKVKGMQLPSLESDQYKAREKFNDMFLAFNGQAWFWHWNVRSESTLSALATPEEEKKISVLAREYSNALSEETAALTPLWKAFLKENFNPFDPKYDLLSQQAIAKQKKARDHRNEVAIQMAKVLAAP